MSRALVIGEALIDIVKRDGQTIGEHVGGSPLNVAVGLGRLGRGVDFLTHIGTDDNGQRVTAHLKDSGVTLVSGSSTAARTPTATAVLDATGAATYEFDLDWQVPSAADVHPPVVAHTGSIAAVLGPGALATAALLDTYRTDATISFDPNVRPALITDREQAIARIERIVERADVVKASDEDLRWIDPTRTPEQIAAAWQKMGPKIVAVTRGEHGASAVCAAGVARIEAPLVQVVDTVGAGDAFMTGLLDALWSLDLLGGGRRAQLSAISVTMLEDVLRSAARVSAYVVARPGAELPRRADLNH